MRGLGYAMFSKCLGPAKHGIPVGKGETMKPMTYYEVFKCNPTAPWHQVTSSPLFGLQTLGL